MLNIEILNALGDVINTIYADPDFAEQQYPGAWRLAEQQPEPEKPALPRWVSVLAFRKRFTRDERAEIEWAAVDRADQSEAQRRLAAEVRAALADHAQATYIDLDDADTVEGVQMLAGMGLLAPGRADEILLAPVQPSELP